MKHFVFAASAACLLFALAEPAVAQQIFSAYSTFDADKTCKHTPGRDPEDYGSWVCRGHSGQIVRLSAGDQRMQVSFGRNARAAAKEEAALAGAPAERGFHRRPRITSGRSEPR